MELNFTSSLRIVIGLVVVVEWLLTPHGYIFSGTCIRLVEAGSAIQGH